VAPEQNIQPTDNMPFRAYFTNAGLASNTVQLSLNWTANAITVSTDYAVTGDTVHFSAVITGLLPYMEYWAQFSLGDSIGDAPIGFYLVGNQLTATSDATGAISVALDFLVDTTESGNISIGQYYPQVTVQSALLPLDTNYSMVVSDDTNPNQLLVIGTSPEGVDISGYVSYVTGLA
jgi:hypothetical protein